MCVCVCVKSSSSLEHFGSSHACACTCVLSALYKVTPDFFFLIRNIYIYIYK